MDQEKVLIYAAMPLRNHQANVMASLALTTCRLPAEGVQVQPTFASGSILPLTFDLLWAGALNAHEEGLASHFAMLHDDVCTAPDWLSILYQELLATDADIMAAVVPIKDDRGLTSTAIETDDLWNPRRLTLAEVFALPATFSRPDLLLNTGCWLCRLDRPWVRRTALNNPDRLLVSFRQQNRIVRSHDGRWGAETISEDWDFSRQVRAAGGTKLYATRKVSLYHERPEFHTRHPWGRWRLDENSVPPGIPPLTAADVTKGGR
jgi:hypothetical protein